MNAISSEPNDGTRSWIVPAVLLVGLWVGFLWFLSSSAAELPERVATHFGFGGQPDGWMSRAAAIRFMLVMGLGLPLLIVALSASLRFLPASMINIPHREYWLAPEHRNRASALMVRHTLWLGCLLVCFMAAMHYLTIRANQTVPAHMPSTQVLVMLGCFLACLGIWIINLVRTFSKPAKAF